MCKYLNGNVNNKLLQYFQTINSSNDYDMAQDFPQWRDLPTSAQIFKNLSPIAKKQIFNKLKTIVGVETVLSLVIYVA